MKPGRIVILSGPSGSGKTTLYQRLLKSPRLRRILVRSISATTRPQRPGEREGRDYFFLTEDEFQLLRQQGFFLEWKKVFVNFYGTPLAAVQEQLKKGKNVLLAIDVQGARTVWRKNRKALKIFVKTPSMKILKERLCGRGSEKPKDLAVRLLTARKELAEAKKYDYVIINDRIVRCYKELERVLLKELTAKG
jgi:guanylate kinase